MKVSYVGKVTDSNGQVKLEFPINTLLDKIIDEWNIIINYFDYFPFAIGKQCDGYHPVTREEFETEGFNHFFIKMYREKKIRYLSDKGVVCVGFNSLCVEGYYVEIGTITKTNEKILRTRCGVNSNIDDIVDIVNRIYISNHACGGDHPQLLLMIN